jgi:hypothetical protein
MTLIQAIQQSHRLSAVCEWLWDEVSARVLAPTNTAKLFAG